MLNINERLLFFFRADVETVGETSNVSLAGIFSIQFIRKLQWEQEPVCVRSLISSARSSVQAELYHENHLRLPHSPDAAWRALWGTRGLQSSASPVVMENMCLRCVFLLAAYETECLAEFPLLLWPLMISSFVWHHQTQECWWVCSNPQSRVISVACVTLRAPFPIQPEITLKACFRKSSSGNWSACDISGAEPWS